MAFLGIIIFMVRASFGSQMDVERIIIIIIYKKVRLRDTVEGVVLFCKL